MTEEGEKTNGLSQRFLARLLAKTNSARTVLSGAGRRLLIRLKDPRRAVMAVCLVLILFALFSNLYIVSSSAPFVFHESAALPENSVGLVLGTTPRLAGGAVNPHFKNRIDAAAFLYHTGKVKHLLVSGDNHLREYNEPVAMKSALMAEGVPESAMTLDYAGLRTLDSVVRAREIFGQSKLTIITDEFHAYRAVFLSKKHGIDAVAYCSEDIPFEVSARARMREYGARIKAVLDLYILHAQPKFLGEKIEIKL